MKILKSTEIANVDKLTIEDTEIPSLVLMESAGRSVVEVILKNYSTLNNICVVAGNGNNGGDAIVVARYLAKLSKNVKLFILSESKEKLSEDNRKNLDIYEKFNLNYRFLNSENFEILREELKDCELIVDGIFGTGFKPPVKGYREDIIKIINESKKPVVSIDLPSGIDADSGDIKGICIKAKITVTFGYLKLCHILYPALDYCGKVFLANISLNDKYAYVKRYLITPENLTLPIREKTGHKYTFGHVLIVGGSVGKSGAVIMTCKSATKSGSGLTTAIIPECINSIVENNIIEEMSIPLPSNDGMFADNCENQILNIINEGRFSSVVVGMGMGISDTNKNIIDNLIKVDKTVVIDADGLNNLANIENFEKKLLSRKNITVLTPHIGEFSRLTKISTKEILEDYESIGKDFAIKTNSFLILKFHRIVLFTPEGEIYYSNKGNPGMATAGSGDVLAGVVGALINRLKPLEALKLAIYIHGLAGDIAAQDVGEESLKATDIINYIPKAFRYIYQLKNNQTVSLVKEIG